MGEALLRSPCHFLGECGSAVARGDNPCWWPEHLIPHWRQDPCSMCQCLLGKGGSCLGWAGLGGGDGEIQQGFGASPRCLR